MRDRIIGYHDALVFARGYTVSLLDTIPPADWFTLPAGCPTHVGWQVGHLAMAEYRLVLDRVRGPQADDESLISTSFLQRFGRDSTADPDPGKNPSPDELRAVFDRVHTACLQFLQGATDADLEGPLHSPHRLCRTRPEVLRWASHHEMLHAGQIGLIRRLLGNRPVW